MVSTATVAHNIIPHLSCGLFMCNYLLPTVFPCAHLCHTNCDCLISWSFLLQGIKAVIAESYERIHRSNLVGMGIVPLQYLPGQTAEGLGLSGKETFTINLPEELTTGQQVTVTVRHCCWVAGNLCRLEAFRSWGLWLEVDVRNFA